MLPTVLLSFCLLLATGAMMVWHWRGWKKMRDADISPADRDYSWSQFRRRAQTTSLLGILALLMLASVWLEHMAPWVFAVYILSMLVLIAWVILLAVADMISTRQHFSHALSKNLSDQTQLKSELYRLKEESEGDRSTGNGKAH